MPSPQPQKQVSGRLRRLAFLLIACTVFTVLAHELKYPASAWPSEREVLSGRSIFGKPGDTRSLVTVTLPYPLRPSWAPDTEITSITCHGWSPAPSSTSFKRRWTTMAWNASGNCIWTFTAAASTTGPSGAPGRPSLHAWGIAVDLDPLRNAMYMRAPEAAFSGPEYDAFWSIVEGEGAFSLGRELGYDWMHIQFVRP